MWGIDLGRSAVKGVLLAPSRHGVNILDADIIPLEGPAENQPGALARDPRLRDALRKFHEKHRLDKTGVCISIPAHNTLVRGLTVASVGRKKMEEMVRFEASNEIPFVLDEVMWDYTLFKQVSGEPARKGFLLAIKKSVIEAHLRAFEELEIFPVALLTVAPLALMKFVQLEMGHKGCALALDMGAQTTSLVVADENRFWMRNIQSGGNHITNMLAERFKLDFEAAEKAKLGLSRSKFAQQIVTALRPAMDGLVRDVKTNLNYLENSEGLGKVEAAYALGGGARMPGVTKLLTRDLRIPVRGMRQLRHVAVSQRADVPFVRANLDRLAVAVGAGIAGLHRHPDDVSFLPESHAHVARLSRWRTTACLAGLLVWLVLLTVYGFGRLVHTKIAGEAAELRSLQQRIETDSRTKSRDDGRTASIEQEFAYILKAGADKNHHVETLDAIINAFRQASGNVAFTIDSYNCEEQERERPRDHPGMLVGTIHGTVTTRGAAAAKPYDRLSQDLMPMLRNALAPPVAFAKARFVSGSTSVEITGENLRDLILPKDAIRPLAPIEGSSPPGWDYYVIEEVTRTKLTLSKEFAGADVEAEAAIVRVVLSEWNPQESTFIILFEVPRRPFGGLKQFLSDGFDQH